MEKTTNKAFSVLRTAAESSWTVAIISFFMALSVLYCADAAPTGAAPPGGALQIRPAAVLRSAGGSDVSAGTLTVTVKVDGKVIPCVASGGTVESLLGRLDISLGNLDIVEPALGATLKEGETVRVTRREYVIRKVEEILPFPVIATTSPDLKPGEEEIYVQGKAGRAITSYKCLTVDGVITEEALVGREVISEPVTQQMLIGFRSVPISKLDFEWEFDENGEPLQYTMALRDQRSSGYSARSGALTASGRQAVVGHVAVNPNVIPYGSKLFIQSSDGKYIYGYAVAADTGIALMDGRVALDCFYDTYEASANHGIKYVDIFVLE